jgi:hypothetical protein
MPATSNTDVLRRWQELDFLLSTTGLDIRAFAKASRVAQRTIYRDLQLFQDLGQEIVPWIPVGKRKELRHYVGDLCPVFVRTWFLLTDERRQRCRPLGPVSLTFQVGSVLRRWMALDLDLAGKRFHYGVNVATSAKEWKVSTKTIYRDLQAIRELQQEPHNLSEWRTLDFIYPYKPGEQRKSFWGYVGARPLFMATVAAMHDRRPQ